MIISMVKIIVRNESLIYYQLGVENDLVCRFIDDTLTLDVDEDTEEVERLNIIALCRLSIHLDRFSSEIALYQRYINHT